MDWDDVVVFWEMIVSEIEDIVKVFGEVIRRVIEVGYDGVEIYGVNMYLI